MACPADWICRRIDLLRRRRCAVVGDGAGNCAFITLGVKVLPVAGGSCGGSHHLFRSLLQDEPSASSERIMVRTSQTFICLNIISSSKLRLLSVNFNTGLAGSRPERSAPDNYIPGARVFLASVRTRAEPTVAQRACCFRTRLRALMIHCRCFLTCALRWRLESARWLAGSRLHRRSRRASRLCSSGVSNSI